ncbi:MAG: hypothetical protein ACOCQS_02160 [Bacillota bacterium]
MLKPPLQPMLLKTVDKPFNSEDHLFEFKWDGFRTILFIINGKIYLQSRNGKDLTPSFQELKKLSKYIDSDNIVLDGEICYFNSDNESRFSILQKRLQSNSKELRNKYPVTYITWDILATNDTYTYNKPLKIRKNILKNMINSRNNLLQISPEIFKDGEKLYKTADKNNFEGIVAKKIDSVYEFKRSDNWKKIKIWNYKDVYIGGYTREKTAFLVGEKIKNKNKLKYLGKVKSALVSEQREALFNFLPELEIKQSPFINPPVENNICWVKPHISSRIKYNELTPDNHFRHGYITELNL